MYYIDEIIKSNDNQKMNRLKEIYEDTMEYLKVKEPEKYNKIECELYEVVEGKKLSKDMAIEWVNNMKPFPKWPIEDIEKVQSSRRIDIPLYDFYVLMNMMYTDYSDVLGVGLDDTDKYIGLSIAWYNDKDTKLTKSEKLYCYYKNIVKGR